jgi:hypothetical protein
MPEIGAIVDTMPDSDSFLPRYLTVQLLAILAEVPAANKSQASAKTSKRAEDFIETFKKSDLFTPLTYSIFWRDNVEQELENNKALLNQTDQYNRAPLTIALANEDFILAHQLIEQGANLLLEDKLVLEIALTSMIQVNDNIIEQILTAAPEGDLAWIEEYLSHLNSNITGNVDPKTTKYHEVLNPPIRNYGQVLDTMSYFNGLPSYYGFLSPSIANLTMHLEEYTESLSMATEVELFAPIAKAYNFTFNNCQFSGNFPTKSGIAATLAKQITDNIRNNSKNITVVFGGWAGNAVTIAFINNFLVFSNLGPGGDPNAGTKIYSIKNPEAITTEAIEIFINGLGMATSPVTILAMLADIVDSNPVYTLQQPLNPIDNCIFVNPRAIIEGILLVLSAYRKSEHITAETLAAQSGAVSNMYKSYVNSLHMHFTNELTRFMRNNELLQNKRIECCSLAIDYINQHYDDPAALERCIELKNALEFVGLKNFYINNISPDAKAAILNIMIQEQEATAIQVIEQERIIGAAMRGTSEG